MNLGIYFPKLLFLLLVFVHMNAGDEENESSEQPHSTSSTDESTTNCASQCYQCGYGALRCIPNVNGCTIACECREGYSGERCEIVDRPYLKQKAWLEIFEESKKDLVSFTSYQLLVKNVADLAAELTRSNQIDRDDIEWIDTILNEIKRLNRQRSYPNTMLVVEMLLNIADRLINWLLSASLPSSSSVYKSTRVVLETIDRLGKYFNRDELAAGTNRTLNLKLMHLKMLVTDFSQLRNLEWIEARSSSQEDDAIFDSISLNRKALEYSFGHQPVRVILKIYSLLKDGSENEIEALENKRKERPTAIYDNLFPATSPADIFLPSRAIVSSSIMSAITSQDLSRLRTWPNLVRIEFTLNNMRRLGVVTHLKCVYWDESQTNWLSAGCHMHASRRINETIVRHVCHCDRLGHHFALLFDSQPTPEPHGLIIPFNEILTQSNIIAALTSSLCYVILIVAQSSQPSIEMLQNDLALRYLYLIKATCLLIANLIFLALVILNPSQIGYVLCLICMSVFQFFLLVAFSFSLAAAWQHHLKLMKIFQNNRVILIYSILVSLLISSGLTVAGLFFQPDRPANLTSCFRFWLPTPYIYYFFVAPGALILLLSLVFYLSVASRMCTINEQNEFQKLRRQIRFRTNTGYNNSRVITLLSVSFFLLSFGWFVELFALILPFFESRYDLKLVFELLFCIANSAHAIIFLVGNLIAQNYPNKWEDSLRTVRANLVTVSDTESEPKVKQNLIKEPSEIMIIQVKEPKRSKKRENKVIFKPHRVEVLSCLKLFLLLNQAKLWIIRLFCGESKRNRLKAPELVIPIEYNN